MVTDRGLAVLRAIVQDYITSREPVGSKAIVDRHSFGVSAATIRNDMALLEEEELIAAPHTSSGRVPTDKGYRVFVDRLSEVTPLSIPQRTAIEQFLDGSSDLEDALQRSVRLLAQLTSQVAMVQVPSLGRARVQHIELVPLSESRLLVVLITDTGDVERRVVEVPTILDEVFLGELRQLVNAATVGLSVADAKAPLLGLLDRIPLHQRDAAEPVLSSLAEQLLAGRQDRLIVAGAANIARTERDFSGSIVPVLDAIEHQVVLLRLFAALDADANEVASSIGREHAEFGLAETSIVASGYRGPGGEVGRLGVLGPTRMDYLGNMAAVRAVARYLSDLLGEG